MNRYKCSLFVFLLIALAVPSLRAQQSAGGLRLVIREIPLSASNPVVAVSKDGRRSASIVSRGGKCAVAVDGKEGTTFDSIDKQSVRFSPDGKRLAYTATRGGKSIVVVDGRESKPYDVVNEFGFSPGGKHFYFFGGYGEDMDAVVDWKVSDVRLTERRGFKFGPNEIHISANMTIGNKHYVLMDGVRGEKYDMVSEVYFTEDGTRYAYTAVRNLKPLLVTDGEEISLPYDSVSAFVFSPNGKRAAYVAGRKGKVSAENTQLVVVGGVAGPEYKEVRKPVFNLQGNHVAYAARRRGMWHMVVDGVEGKEYDTVSDALFSPDGLHMIYSAIEGDNILVFVDGVQRASYPYSTQVGPIIWDQGGRKYAWLVRREGSFCAVVEGKEGTSYGRINESTFKFMPDGRLVFIAAQNYKSALVVDGKEGGWYSFLNYRDPVVYSPDGRRTACLVRRDDQKQMMIVDGSEGPAFQEVKSESFHFSPDSRHYAYVAVDRGKYLVIRDGAAQDVTSLQIRSRSLVFSPDSRHLAFLAGPFFKACVVVDGVQSASFSYPGDELNFESPRLLRTRSVKNNQPCRVEVEIAGD